MRAALLAIALLLAACAPRTAADQDILDAYQARLGALTEAVNSGRMTRAEAVAQEAEAWSRAQTEIELRRSARFNRAVQSGPTICTPAGANQICW